MIFQMLWARLCLLAHQLHCSCTILCTAILVKDVCNFWIPYKFWPFTFCISWVEEVQLCYSVVVPTSHSPWIPLLLSFIGCILVYVYPQTEEIYTDVWKLQFFILVLARNGRLQVLCNVYASFLSWFPRFSVSFYHVYASSFSIRIDLLQKFYLT